MAFAPFAVWPLKFVRCNSSQHRLDETEGGNHQYLDVSLCGNSEKKNIGYFNAVFTAFCAPIVKCIHYTVSIQGNML